MNIRTHGASRRDEQKKRWRFRPRFLALQNATQRFSSEKMNFFVVVLNRLIHCYKKQDEDSVMSVQKSFIPIYQTLIRLNSSRLIMGLDMNFSDVMGVSDLPRASVWASYMKSWELYGIRRNCEARSRARRANFLFSEARWAGLWWKSWGEPSLLHWRFASRLSE